ncbi:RNA polymerase-associated protein rtf1 [Clydaea vesicula]|uniref:RNA polymerase-associated protein rtf1 n=1 Tax=Clydaea vesicula TaxID=447962 RepID=A0AAD5XYM3_9FUNG|nr:RNA polymerase-associated protein rtf1 [Clydaea vesicula]
MSDLDAELMALAGFDEGPVKSKKRTKRKKEESSSEDSEEELDEYDDEYYGDAADRERLEAMTALEREQILTERAEKRQFLLDKRQVKNKLNAGKAVKKVKDEESDRRKSSRKQTEKEKKSNSLSALKNQREKKKDPGYTGGLTRDFSSEEDGEFEDESIVKEDPVEKSDIDSIQITRDELEKWCYSPFFDRTVIGCFVRVGLQMDAKTSERVYRICLIKEVVDHHKVYQIGHTQLNKALLLAHGKAEKKFTMDIISNSPFTQEEWNRYMRTLKNEKILLTPKAEIKDKVTELDEARKYVLTEKEINEMVEKKKSFKKIPTNIASEKLKLKRDLELARQDNPYSEMVQNLELKLKEIEEKFELKLTTNSDFAAKMKKLNEKNRRNNLLEGKEAERKALGIKNEEDGKGILSLVQMACVVKLVDNIDLVDDNFFDYLDLSVLA